MNSVGFCNSDYRAFEMNSYRGNALSSTTIFTSFRIYNLNGEVNAATAMPSFIDHLSKVIFREDSFDPITKLRRGRLYKGINQNPVRWYRSKVSDDVITQDFAISDGDRSITPFEPFRISSLEISFSSNIIKLGNEPYQTPWRLASIEKTHTGDEILTLRSLNSLGILPILTFPNASKKIQDIFNSEYEVLSRELSSVPETVIDHCRDVATIAIKASGAVSEEDDSDLNDLSNKLEKGSVTQMSAKIIARLHSRRKPNMQVSHSFKELTYEDSELAVQCLGFLLRNCSSTNP